MHTTDPSPSFLRASAHALRACPEWNEGMTTPRCHPERSEGSLANFWAITSYYSLSKNHQSVIHPILPYSHCPTTPRSRLIPKIDVLSLNLQPEPDRHV